MGSLTISVFNFTTDLACERILEIGQCMKLWMCGG